ncbi:hypothetical protein EG68_06282 [Paragonimus skrjabini miyazakii]|uniref:Ig-like domain-containing protein n=1 Tax=Paragonimus skrjabini miyazakii TaxID=59628 RepID=A0A8S9YLW8_9TREM|nr:hypothetical protein EG68_06282 [Paragonimus skrjabini miyazakii]
MASLYRMVLWAWFILICSDEQQAIRLHVTPQGNILYKDVDSKLTVYGSSSGCIGICPIMCTIRSVLGYVKAEQEWYFNQSVSLEPLQPGVYILSCAFHSPLLKKVTKRLLLLNKNTTYLDCAGAPWMIYYTGYWPDHRVCCRRHPLSTDWLRKMRGSLRTVCQPTHCSSNSSLIGFTFGILYVVDMGGSNPKRVWIQCEGKFETWIYFQKPPVQILEVKIYPLEQLVFSHTVKQLTTCIGWSDENTCLEETTMHSQIRCQVNYYGHNQTNQMVNLTNFTRVMRTDNVPEGQYKISCWVHRFNISGQRTCVILHQGLYVLRCRAIPRIIYLDRNIVDLPFCLWIATVRKVWQNVLRSINALTKQVECGFYVPQVNFLNKNTTEKLTRAKLEIGLYELRCGKSLVTQNIWVADTSKHVEIRVSPSTYILNNTHYGTLEAKLFILGLSGIMNRYLQYMHPVTCRLVYSIIHQHLVWNFTDSIKLEMLLDGPMQMHCKNVDLNVSTTVQKFVVTTLNQPAKCLPPKAIDLQSPMLHRYVTCRNALLPRPLLMPITSETDQPKCIDAQKRYSFANGQFTITVAPTAPAMQPLMCSGSNKNHTIFFYDANGLRNNISSSFSFLWKPLADNSVKLRISPKQDFYVFSQTTPVKMYFYSKMISKYENRLLKETPLRCSLFIKHPSDHDAELVKEINGNTLNLQTLGVEQKSNTYLIECSAFDRLLSDTTVIIILDPRDVSLKIVGAENNILFNDAPYTFTCVLNSPVFIDPAPKPQWITLKKGGKATVYSNELRVDKNSSLGWHAHLCVYMKTWITLKKILSFVLYDKSQLTLQTKFSNRDRSFVSYMGNELPTISCVPTGVLRGDKLQVNWTLLSGNFDYQIYYNRTDTIIKMNGQRQGYATMRCSSSFESRCLSRIVILLHTGRNIMPRIVPRRRVQVRPTTIGCDLPHRPLRLDEYTLSSKSHFTVKNRLRYLQIDERAVLIQTTRQFGEITCRTIGHYLGTRLNSNHTTMVNEIIENVTLEIYPRTANFRIGGSIRCVEHNLIYDEPPIMQLLVYPDGVKPRPYYRGNITFDGDFTGGPYVVRCLLLSRSGVTFSTNHAFSIHEEPWDVFIEVIKRNNTLSHFHCQPTGYPTDNLVYSWNVNHHPGGVLMSIGKDLYITKYTVAGYLSVTCEVWSPESQNFDSLLIDHEETLASLFMKVFARKTNDRTGGYLIEEYGEQNVGNSFVYIKEADIKPIFNIVRDLLNQYAVLYELIQQSGVLHEQNTTISHAQASLLLEEQERPYSESLNSTKEEVFCSRSSKLSMQQNTSASFPKLRRCRSDPRKFVKRHE